MSERIFDQSSSQPPAFKRVEVIGDELDEDTLKQILAAEGAAFGEDMQSDPEDIRAVLGVKEGVHLLMRNPEREIVGYISTLPQNDEYEDLVQYDPDFIKDETALYLESIGSRPENRDPYLSVEAFDTLIEEARKKGYRKLTMHARVSNGFSRGLQKLYGAKCLRRLENWHDFGEPFDYLEIEIPAIEKDR